MDGAARSKIVCTIGPASRRPDILREMAAAGMDLARFNLSHGTLDEHRNTVRAVRSLGSVAVLFDLPGPKIRVGELKAPIVLQNGDTARFTVEESAEPPVIPISYPLLPTEVRPGGHIYVDDGRIDIEITKVDTDLHGFEGKVATGGTVESHKGVNAPGASLSMRPPTEQDLRGIKFGVELGVDWFAASFVRGKGDVEAVKSAIEEAGGEQPLVSKIEHGDAIRNIDEIVRASDGVMVARGDLGIEVPPWEVPLLQKRIISSCNEAGRPVIVATQMLESMVASPHPTRAEASDVANALLDGADAVMLSEETATGSYPVEAVRVMESIGRVVEAGAPQAKREVPREGAPIADVLGSLAASAVDALHPAAVIAVTRSGFTALMASKYRPAARLFAVVRDAKVGRRIRMFWGVEPLDVPWTEERDELVVRAVSKAVKDGFVRDSDTVLVVSGSSLEEPGRTSSLEALRVRDVLAHEGKR